MSKRIYISADYSEADRDVIDVLHTWGVSSEVAHCLPQARWILAK